MEDITPPAKTASLGQTVNPRLAPAQAFALLLCKHFITQLVIPI
ncbi:hypothetical protein UUU_24470 [Klebsiella pneumoniae subsp. pneumoniae DSM 30104 = JCM 1662 = NBRC 14940]|nr:hypothetical protein UUU_24470 [Klebsiella pneumoniae subsp. pneumoniae DSM 30104 = JCM 1662 = NBRC 14940]